MEGGKEQNFWPGFVDALSNVVLVMIFVVVVFVVTLFYYSQKLTQFRAVKFIERQEQQKQDVTPPTSNPALTGQKKAELGNQPPSGENSAQAKEIADLKAQVASLKMQLAANTQTISGSMRSAEGAPSKAIQVEKDKPAQVVDVLPGIALDAQADAITLQFDRDGVELGSEATKKLDANIRRWADRIKSGQGKVVVTGVIGTVSYTEGRRRAYYRAMAVRNYLIDVGVSPSSVVSRVVPGAESTNGDASVVIQYVSKAS
ncbi:hypothetical protein [uncultured Oxalicibacterium sp.]|uniref:hypothetical protein n=1 Tax=uncultured Oxalicibacterium sp. TaxID=1168540 RepID=UPI0025EAA66C|nr:hypothetical protein [uncultured Oxalicibacterium sp.]